MLKKSTESEKSIERILYNLVKANGGLCIKLVPLHFAGIPDRLVLMPNKQMCFVETKSTGENARRLQRIVHSKIRALGFDVHVPDTIDKVKIIINLMLS